MKLSPFVVPFLSFAMACSAIAPAPRVRIGGSYAIVIDNRVSSVPVGGYGQPTAAAMYEMNQELRKNLASVTFVAERPQKANEYDAVIFLAPQGDAIGDLVVINYTIEKSDAPEQRGVITYDPAQGTLGGFAAMVKKAAATPAPSGASAGARR